MCGARPYAGGSVVTRGKEGGARTADAIPAWVERIFRETARRHGFEYDAMCISNVTDCQD